jgi:hypothetical protein
MRYRNTMLRRMLLIMLLAGFATAAIGCGKDPPQTIKKSAPAGRMPKPPDAK